MNVNTLTVNVNQLVADTDTERTTIQNLQVQIDDEVTTNEEQEQENTDLQVVIDGITFERLVSDHYLLNSSDVEVEGPFDPLGGVASFAICEGETFEFFTFGSGQATDPSNVMTTL